MRKVSFRQLVPLFVFIVFMGGVIAALAQTNAPAGGAGGVPSIGGISGWDLLIGAITPVLVWLLAKFVPSLPSVVLPTITPFIGVGLGYAVNYFANKHLPWFDAAKAGALAVFIREVTNQWVTGEQSVTKQMSAPKE